MLSEAWLTRVVSLSLLILFWKLYQMKWDFLRGSLIKSNVFRIGSIIKLEKLLAHGSLVGLAV